MTLGNIFTLDNLVNLQRIKEINSYVMCTSEFGKSKVFDLKLPVRTSTRATVSLTEELMLLKFKVKCVSSKGISPEKSEYSRNPVNRYMTTIQFKSFFLPPSIF